MSWQHMDFVLGPVYSSGSNHMVQILFSKAGSFYRMPEQVRHDW